MHTTPPRPSVARLVVFAALAVLAPLLPPVAGADAQEAPTPPARPWDIELVADDFVGTVNSSPSDHYVNVRMTPSISDDGRHATALRWTEDEAVGLYLQDLESGSSTLIESGDVPSDGYRTATPPTTTAVVSGDGSTVVYPRSHGYLGTTMEVFTVDGFRLTLPAPPDSPDYVGALVLHGVSDDGHRILMSIPEGRDEHAMYVVDWTTTPVTFTTVFSAADPNPTNVTTIREARLSGDGTTVVAKVTTGHNVYGLQMWDLSATADGFVPAEYRSVHWESAFDISDDGTTVVDVYGCAMCPSAALNVHHRDTGVTDSWHPSEIPFDGFQEGHIGYETTYLGAPPVAVSGDGSTVLVVVQPGYLGGPADQVYALDVATGEFSRATVPYTTDDISAFVSVGAVSDDGSRFVFLTDNEGLFDPASLAGAKDYATLYAVATRADTGAPTWPAGAAISVDGVGASFVNVSWPAASDDRGVTGYRVYLDGAQVAETAGDVRVAHVDGLDADTTYTISVQALDATGAPSAFLTVEVTTETLTTGTAPLAATANDDGTVALSWDAVTGAEKYAVIRTIGTDTTVVGQPVTTRHTDIGVPAETDVTYRVDAVIDGETVAHTVDATVTTSSITDPTVTWTAPRMRGSVGDIGVGATVTITVAGQPGRVGDATITTEADGTTTTHPVTLTETDPGVYTGEFTVPAGITALTSLSTRLHDGAGHEATATATGFPVAVAGSVRVTFDTDADLDGFAIDISSRAATWSYRRDLTGRDPLVVPAPVTDDMQVILRRSDGSVSDRADGIEITSGAVADVDITAWHRAPLIVTVVDPAGDPVPDVRVDVAATDAPVATRGTTDGDGTVVSDAWTNRQSVTVSISSDVVVLDETTPTTLTLVPGDNTLEVVAPVVPRGTITGTFTDPDGRAVPGAMIVLSQVVNDVPHVYTVKTDETGEFTIDGIQATGRITASTASLVAETTVTLGPDPVHIDLVGVAAQWVSVEVDLRTRGVGDAEWGPAIGIDWSTASHLRLVVEEIAPDGTVRRARTGRWEDSRTTILVYPGTRFRVCADAREAGGGAGCSELVTARGDGATNLADLRLEARGHLQLSLLGSDGAPPTGRVRATISSLGPRFSDTITTDTGRIDTHLPHAGEYQVTVQSGQRTVAATIDVLDGEVTRSTIQLPPASGPFIGEGNGLTAAGEVLPGDVVILRGQYHAGADVAGATYSLQVPPGWTPIGSGVVVDGVPTSVDVDGTTATVPLGDLAIGDEGLIHIPAEVPADANPDSVYTATASIVDASDRTHPVGAAEIAITGLSIDGPETVHEFAATLSGRAPAGTLVTIIDGDTTIGMAAAGPSGRWQARVDLPERGAGSTYRLQATSDDPALGTTEPVDITYDPNRARLRAITVSQDGRTVTVEPTGRTQRFPFVIVSKPLTVALAFDRGDAVTSARVRVGETSLDAVRQDDGTFVARMDRFSMGDEGPITVYFDSESIPLEPDDPAVVPTDPGALAALLPPGFSPLVNPQAEETVSGSTETLEVSASLPSLAGADGTVPQLSVTISQSPQPGYVPSQQAIAEAEEIGLDIYEPTVTIADDGLSGSASGYHVAPDAAGGGVQFFAPAQIEMSVRMSIQIAWKITDAADDTKDVLSIVTGEKYEKLERLRNRIDDLTGCVPSTYERQWLYDYVDSYAKEALATDLISATLIGGGVAAGMVSFGLGFGVAVGGWLLEQALGYKFDHQIDRLTETIKQIREDYDCDGDGDANLRPDYIYDPSGFTYEATEDNRLAGVTTTVLYSPTPTGPWQVWDAHWYLQQNPLVTNDEGMYAWDVPRGFWRVQYDKDGYETTYSEVLEVLPPHFDVNVGLVSTEAPAVVDVDGDGSIEIEFTQPMKLDWVQPAVTVVDTDAASVATAGPAAIMAAATPSVVPGTVEAVDRATTPDGDTVATTFRFVPDEPVDDGTPLTVTVDTLARNYADRPLLDAHTATITFAAAPDDDDGDDGDGGGNDGGGDDDDGSNGTDDGGPGTGDGSGTGTDDGSSGDPRLPGAPGSTAGALPRTGTSPDLARLGALLIIAGTAMATTGRRRRRHP